MIVGSTASTVGGDVVVALVVGLALGLAIINGLKGKTRFALGGVIIHVLWIVGAILLAKPDSWWASRFYDADKLRLAQQRFPNSPAERTLGSPDIDSRPSLLQAPSAPPEPN
jgi:hypothetical protein